MKNENVEALYKQVMTDVFASDTYSISKEIGDSFGYVLHIKKELEKKRLCVSPSTIFRGPQSRRVGFDSKTNCYVFSIW